MFTYCSNLYKKKKNDIEIKFLPFFKSFRRLHLFVSLTVKTTLKIKT